MRPIDADALVADLNNMAEEWIAMEKHVPTEFKQYYRGKFEAVMDIMAQVNRNTPTLDLAPKWISVNDGVPPDRIDKPGSERCFVYGVTPEGKKVIAISRFYDGEWVLFGELASSDVTHWMPNPNPQPPKEES